MMLSWLKKIFDWSDDPVYSCDLYRDKTAGSCAHVDGPLCDFPKCSMLADYRAAKAAEAVPQPNQLPNGLTLVQQNPDCAVDLTGGRYHGWLFVRGPDGQWVTHRKLEGWEIMQAEDQRDYGIVQQGTKVRAG